MRNQSGKTFENARIKLLAGDVSKIAGQHRERPRLCCGKDGDGRSRRCARRPREVLRRISSLHAAAARPLCATRKPSRWSSSAPPDIHAQRLYVYDGAARCAVRLLQPRADPQGTRLRHGVQSQGLGDGGVQELRSQSSRHRACPRASCASIAATPTATWSSSARTPSTTLRKTRRSASTPATPSTWSASASAPTTTWIPTSTGWTNRSRSACATTRKKR